MRSCNHNRDVRLVRLASKIEKCHGCALNPSTGYKIHLFVKIVLLKLITLSEFVGRADLGMNYRSLLFTMQDR